MTIIKICGIIFICLSSVVVLKNIKSNYAYIAVVSGALVIAFALIDSSINPVLGKIKEESEQSDVSEYITILFKALGISYISAITSDICHNAGEEDLSNLAQIAGKLEILSLSLPLATQLIETSRKIL